MRSTLPKCEQAEQGATGHQQGRAAVWNRGEIDRRGLRGVNGIIGELGTRADRFGDVIILVAVDVEVVADARAIKQKPDVMRAGSVKRVGGVVLGHETAQAAPAFDTASAIGAAGNIDAIHDDAGAEIAGLKAGRCEDRIEIPIVLGVGDLKDRVGLCGDGECAGKSERAGKCSESFHNSAKGSNIRAETPSFYKFEGFIIPTQWRAQIFQQSARRAGPLRAGRQRDVASPIFGGLN